MSSNVVRFGVNFMVLVSLFSAPLCNSWAQSDVAEVTPIFAPNLNNKAGIGVDLNKFPSNVYFTLAPDVTVEGPIYPLNDDDEARKQEYVRQVFRRLVQKADRIAKGESGDFEYVDGANDNFTYYTFLVLAMAVPHHESQLMHSREVLGQKCYQTVNDFTYRAIRDHKPFGKTVGENLPKIMSIYKNQNPILIPECRNLNKDEVTKQLLISGLYEDIGIMQINAKSHPEIAEPKMYLSVFDSIDYGINFISQGYEKIRSNFDKYTCSFSLNPYSAKDSKAQIYYNLVRATWGGQYNSGNLLNDSVCRFADVADPDERDNKFRVSLNSIIRDDNSMYHKYLPKGSLERGAFLEIVNNFRAAFSKTPVKEQNKNLKILLSQPMDAHLDWMAPARIAVKTTHILNADKVQIFTKAKADPDNSCGYLDGKFSSSVPVRVLLSDSIPTESGVDEKWSYIEVPQFASFMHKFSANSFVQLKVDASAANLRSDKVIKADNIVGQINKRKGQPVQLKMISEEQDSHKNIWYKVISEDGQTVYVSESRVDVFEVPGTLNPDCNSAPNRGQTFWVKSELLKRLPPDFVKGKKYLATVTGKNTAYLRATANDTAKILERHNAGENLTVIGQQTIGTQKWYMVLTSSGDTAFVTGSRLELVSEMKEDK